MASVIPSCAAVTGTSLSIAAAVPLNARAIRGSSNCQNLSATSSTLAVNISADSAFTGQQYNQGVLIGGQIVQNFSMDLRTAQQVFYAAASNPVVSSIFAIYITGYSI